MIAGGDRLTAFEFPSAGDPERVTANDDAVTGRREGLSGPTIQWPGSTCRTPATLVAFADGLVIAIDNGVGRAGGRVMSSDCVERAAGLREGNADDRVTSPGMAFETSGIAIEAPMTAT